MKIISVVTPCYNEQHNIRELHEAVAREFVGIPEVDYEHIFIDNGSTDGSQDVLREMARSDKRVKVILNRRNFGHVRSFYHAVLQSTGDATLVMAADFQDPPTLIPRFISEWRAGNSVVLGVKSASDEQGLLGLARRLYYALLRALSEVPLIDNATGFGLFDRSVIDELRKLRDPYPYFRGLVIDLGFVPKLVEFHQPKRKRGVSGNSLYALYDMAMLGITNHSKIPLRLATMSGFLMSLGSLAVGVIYLVYKLLYWQQFPIGTAPLVIGLFFFASVQLFFIGILGEYIGSIHTQVLKRPLVVEKERINF
jgi:glycosyltransferase involved in cell wall biosynthesis